MSFQSRLIVSTLAALLGLGAAATAYAQGHGGGGGGGMGAGGMGRGGPGGGPGMGPGAMGGDRGPLGTPTFPNVRPDSGPPPAPGSGNQSTVSTMHPGLQLGPPGRWWDDKSFARSLKLRTDQQIKMDSIFEQNRAALLSRYQGLQQAEAQMEEISRTPAPDEAILFAGIDRVAQARAELEKATTHYLLQIRKEMDADQIQRLEKHR